jgi:hypothetical protein
VTLLLEVWNEKKAEFMPQIVDFKRATKHLSRWVAAVHALLKLIWPKQHPMIDLLLLMVDLRAEKQWLERLKQNEPQHEDILCQVFRLITNIEGVDHIFKNGIHALEQRMRLLLWREDEKIVIQDPPLQIQGTR